MNKPFLVTLALLSVSILQGKAAESPASVQAVVKAAQSAGLVVAGDFSHQPPLPVEELASLKQMTTQTSWLTEIPNLEAAVLQNYPAEVGVHQGSGFRIQINYSGDDIILLICSVPLVNGGKKEQNEMIETMLAATEALVGRKTDVRSWLNAEWKKSWKFSAKPGASIKDVIRKKQFGPFLVSVWGAAPDIVILNCVRMPNHSSETVPSTGH